ncbi:MAG: dTDP-glucose 4,6-dehydratase [Nitrospiraceae bacterium]|nr:dTDP-glucose 4,6-dehydratase [Nitrospiraceae bacterium]
MITGAAGFIGSAFARLAVSKGLLPVCVDKLSYAGDLERLKSVSDKIHFHKADIADKEAIGRIIASGGFPPRAIVHFAAETHVDRSIIDPASFIKANVTGTENLLELALFHGVEKFIHISTDEVYGDLLAGAAGFRETDCLAPNSPYSASKAGADMFVRAFRKTFGLPVITVRPSNNYGPWQYPEKLIPLCIARAMRGESIPLYGTGENIRTWLFVEDCAEAILQVLERGRDGETYNIGSSEEKMNREVIGAILKHLGKGEELVKSVPDRPGHDFRYAVDTAKIEKETGWKARVRFDEGIEKTVRWYGENSDWLFRKADEARAFTDGLKRRFGEMGTKTK